MTVLSVPTHVIWIAPHPKAHIQATGRDAKGRKQYRYHADWSSHRTSVKFDQLREFGHTLGPLRVRVDEDLSRRDLSHERVVALMVALLDLTAVRIGSEACPAATAARCERPPPRSSFPDPCRQARRIRETW